MARILYVDMSTLGLHDAHFRALLDQCKDASSQVEVVHIQDDELVSATLPAEPYYYRSLFKTIKWGEDQGYDAAIIGCCADPGLKEARNMTRMPVVGPFMAGMHLATMLGRRVGVLCPAKNGKRQRPFSWHEDNLLGYGFQAHLAKFRAVNLDRPDQAVIERLAAEGRLAELGDLVLSAHRRSIMGEALAQARSAVAEGADVLFFACTLWGGMVDPIAAELGVPVVDPIFAVLKLAEIMAGPGRVARGRPVQTSK